MANGEWRINGEDRVTIGAQVLLDFGILALPSSFDICASSFTAGVPASSFWSRDISRCADWLRYVLAPVPPSPGRSLRVRRPSSGCWSENETDALRDRKGFVRQGRNLANRWDTRASRLPRPCRVLPPATCTREFLPPTQCRVLPGAYKSAHHCLLPEFVEVPRAMDSRSRTDVN